MHHKPIVSPSKARHDIVCAPWPEFRFLYLIWNQNHTHTKVFQGILHLNPLCSLCERRKCWGQTAAAAIDFESRRCDAHQKKKTVWSSWTWQAAQVASQPHPAASPLINLSPLFLFLLPLFPVWGLCTSVREASFHSLAQQDATQPVSPRKRREMFYVRGELSAFMLS